MSDKVSAGPSEFADPPPLRQWLDQARQRFPQAVAVESAQASLSYEALQGAVADLVARLRSAGLTPGDCVGIAATRDAQTIVSIVACVHAGLGYVPLDLSYPAERLTAMLEDARPRVVLGTAQAMNALRQAVGDVPTLDRPAERTETVFGQADDLTYVLFTSGSTGRPKGVAMGGRPLGHLIAWHAQHPRLGQAARTLQFAPLSFDVHFQEIFSTLACGGTLVLVADEQRRDPAQLHAALIEQRVERIFLPYVALQMIAQASQERVPASLREVVSAGEQLQVTPAIRSMFMRLPGAQLHNHYGPTESHVVTAHELTGDAAAWPEIPPIGAALPHVRLALRNADTGAEESGDTGELLLGGDTLAHGYLGRPDLSAERFRSDLAAFPGRWYTTGDLVRRDAAGTYTYLGRADQQLKVDGFRIEPGEIELALMAHDAVRDAVVTAPDMPGIGKQLVAYLVLKDAANDAAAVIAQLRAQLRDKLPAYMVPVRYVTLERLPTTPSGKIDRRSLPLPAVEAAAAGNESPTDLVRRLWQDLLGADRIGDGDNLFDIGARSLLVMRFVTRMKDLGHARLTVADVYDRPTVAGIASALAGAPREKPQRAAQAQHSTAGIAIVGLATRTAGAKTPQQFWDDLLAGREGIRHFAPHELDASVPQALKSRSNFVAARGVIEDADRFDAAFFGISAREATMLDPQQRLFLELCWNALESAAIDPTRTHMRVGVYAGTANNSYGPALRAEQPELVQQAGEFAMMLASEKDYVATRAANRLNLNGPAVSIHTACSTGLVAVCEAWHALANGLCDAALAGGVTVLVPQEAGYLHVEGGMESADGHCRPFDADASGTVFASGGAVVVLKRVEDAQRDGDTIYAVIRGVGLNNDGGDKASFTAPSVSGQAGAIRMALDHAQVSARSIGYVETHGTGTALGDPIEIAGLTRAWREDTTDNQFCAIGSVKSNLGHTIAAAGVLGLIKAALALHHEVIPATLHFQRPNAQIDFAATPFTVCAANTPWPRSSQPRRAAVSSFGVGGTNAHVVIEEAPVAARGLASGEAGLQLLPLSARTPQAVLQRARELADHLERYTDLPLADVAATLMRGRRAMTERAAVVAGDRATAAAALRALKSSATALSKPRVVFLFPGQGSQHPGMARGLYDEVSAFREALDVCLAAMPAELAGELRTWLIEADPKDTEVGDQLAETRHSQPALFAMSYALAAWLDSLGVKPDALIGHSIGEYAAACHAGVFNVHDAVAAVMARGQAMYEQPRGAMLAVRTGAEAVAAMLPAGVEIAGCNAPALTVVAGGFEAIDAFAKHLEAQDIGTTRLKVSHAFHSATMEGALPLVEAALAQTTCRAPAIPVYSCVSGAPLAANEATNPQYWARQVRMPVQFSRAVQAELAQGDCVFVEVGPGQALTALTRQHRTPKGEVPRIVPLLGTANEPGLPAVNALQGLGALWSAGVEVAWPVPFNARRVPLPTYPFNGERHWFARRVAAPDAAAAEMSPPATPSQVVPTMSRIPRLEQELKRILSDVSGVPSEDMTADATFVDQGLDSLSLTQATLELERVFGVKLRFRRLLEDLDTVGKLSQFLDGELPADKFAPLPAAVAPAPAAAPAAAPMASGAAAAVAVPLAASMPVAMPMFAATPLPVEGNAVHMLLSQQMQLMSQQLALLSGQAPAALAPMPVVAQPVAAQQPTAQPVAAAPAAAASGAAPQTATAPAVAESAQPGIKALVEKPFGASARITLDAKQDFTPAQRKWLDEFIARYVARSGKSKSFSQAHRKVMADPRVVTGFNPLWKDLVYPIVVDRSNGARLWDVDGNEYIDLLSCFGANLLGYQQPQLVQAMAEQLQRGLEVGPQHPLSAEVAALISEFTGMERVAFCNTGSEAVMGAMRIARTVTGRKTIAIFTNSYHGIFDEVIVRGTKQLRSLSAAPGILANAVENILVLDWASEDSLRVLRERGSELAAIMTEPIQNKYPTVQPREFVQSLRKIADEAGCALIFDEVVTGFRVAPGGAQEFYGVRADIATYGKVIGGGLPFAAIAGGSRWLDALDGGHWQYGDDSYPEAGVTYFAGTFVRHPLALAAAKAALLHLKRGGRELYRALNDRTQRLIDRLNTAFAVRGAPVKAVHCASLWRLQWDDGQRYVSFFYYLLRFHGLHVYEQFGHFVTEAMTDADTDRIFEVFTKSLDELMALGFITPRDGTPPPSGPKDRSDTPALPDQAPLTPGQTERWLAASFDENARRALNESLCLELRGTVDLAAMEAALVDVMSRHEAFRIVFDATDPLQSVSPQGRPQVHRVDLRGSEDVEAALDRFCEEASRRDFKLNEAPLGHASLVTLSDGRTVVHLVVSHLVFDGWASPVFLQDLATAYRARSTGLTPQWTAVESPRAFGIAEQARWEGAQGEASRAYWREQLGTPPASLSLGDRTPPVPRRFAGDTLRARIEGVMFQSLGQLARRHKATMFQVLLAAVTEMVHRRTGRDDFVISIPFASQSLDRHAPLIGDGVLDLPLRLRRRAADSFPDVLAHVKNQLMDALEHPLATQGSVAREVGVASVGSRPPLTGVYFNLNPRLDVRGFEPLKAEVRESRKLGLLSEVIFNFYETPNALTLDLHHSTEFFSPQRAQEVVDSLTAVLRELSGSTPSIAATPAASAPAVVPAAAAVSAPAAKPSVASEAPASALTAEDLQRLAKWNATDTPYETGLRLGDLIARTVARQPDAVAVRFEGHSVTYAELDRMAWALAHHLRAQGVKPGDLVGVCLDRSVELVAALVGVVYSGGAYVPLDPAYPRDRLTHMCEDAKLQVVVTRSAEFARAGAAFPASIQRVLMDQSPVSQWSEATAGALVGTSEDPAYVIFTSGSTGRPKGAMNAHKGIVNRLQWMQQEYQLTPSDRVMQKTPYSFDVSVWEFFWPLMMGATIVVARPDGHRDASYLAQLIQEEAVTVLHFVPSMLRLFLEEPRGEQCRSVRQVVCSGEALPIDAVDKFFEVMPHSRLGNLYGPTEAAVDVTCWNCVPGDPRRIVPIGRPIANTRMYVLGEKLELLPVGQEGELYIGGIQVGMGYVSRPDLTSERFLPDPYLPGGRMYKTGDIGRWLDDGAIEYLGRADHQVKIRGFRIELGEIEAQLMTSPAVGRCVVVARDFGGGDMRLVAYVVPKGMMPEAAELKAHLAANLPEWMVPQVYVAMGDIPLLPNGKIDRKALPTPPQPKVSVSAAAQAPQGEVQEALASIMKPLLKVPAIGAHDDFFALGGHSLLAARVIAQVNKQLGTQLTLRSLFEAPTIDKLAAVIDAQRGGAATTPKREPITHRADQTQAPLTLMQERVRFIEEMQPGRVVYNAPSAHRLKGPLDAVAFDRAFLEMIRRQPALRTSIVREGDGYVQHVSDVQFSLLPLEDLRGVPAAQREQVLMQRLEALTAQTFQLDQGPLFKARLFRLDEEEHALFFMTHHVIWDGWSFDVLYTEISALYADFLAGRAPSLAPLPVTYGDYADWHNRWLSSQELADQVAYWKKQFAQGSMPRAPHGDFPRQQAGAGRGATEWMHLHPPQVERIHDLARQTSSTLSIVMLSVYAAMMSQWLGDPCPAIGMPVRGRTQAELEGVMGFFNNMLPVRLQVDPTLSARDWIRHVRQTMVSAFASQDAPFEILARELDAGTSGGASRLYQVMFSFQDARARQTHWGPLAHERIPLLQKGATEDINLWMVEIPNGIEGGVQYNADLFLPSTAAALRDRFLALLEAVIREPDRSVASLLALRDDERKNLSAWGGSTRRPGTGSDFVDAIGQLAQKTPSAAALHVDGKTVSRADLGQRVADLSARLRDASVASTGQALVQIDDVTAHAAAALALWQHGLSVASATSEQSFDPSKLAVVISQHAPPASLPATVQWIHSGTSAGAAPSVSDNPITPQTLSRAELAEVIETLSSQVKLLPGDRALCYVDDEPAQRLFMIVTALAAGAEAYVAPAGFAADAQRMADTLLNERIALMRASGSAWRSALAGAKERPLELVAMVDVQELNADLASQLLDKGCTLLSVYRPQSLGMPLSAALVRDGRDCLVFGQPLLAGALQPLDASGQPVPAMVAAELHVTLAGRSLGTESLARWRSDGQLQYLGELGATAYLDGRRINMGALREQILAVPGVAAAGIGVRDDAVLHRCLVIGIEPAAQAPSDAAHWEREVHRLLSGVASVRVVVGPLARLADGSVDVASLLSRRRPAAAAASASLTPTQQALVDVWKDLLGLPDVGLQDNFFELGGTSLLAMRAAQHLEEKLDGRRVSPRRYVFETLAQLAAAFDEAEAQPSTAVVDITKPAANAAAKGGMLQRLRRLVSRA